MVLWILSSELRQLSLESLWGLSLKLYNKNIDSLEYLITSHDVYKMLNLITNELFLTTNHF